jgi:hypothetical protein
MGLGTGERRIREQEGILCPVGRQVSDEACAYMGCGSPAPARAQKRKTCRRHKRTVQERFTVMYFHEYAKVWSKRLRFSPQKVGGTFALEDSDTVEIHMK